MGRYCTNPQEKKKREKEKVEHETMHNNKICLKGLFTLRLSPKQFHLVTIWNIRRGLLKRKQEIKEFLIRENLYIAFLVKADNKSINN